MCLIQTVEGGVGKDPGASLKEIAGVRPCLRF